MTRPILSGLLGLLSVAVVGSIPLACQSGGVGDPCTPEDEYNAQFAGFKVTEENIESRSFQCETRICLVNHFQGRVSCPLGQEKPTTCQGIGQNDLCKDGETCVEAGVLAPDCTSDDQCADFGGSCNEQGKFCECVTSCPTGFFCDADTRQCKSYVCHKEGSCQTADGADSNGGKGCCIPGTDTPIGVPVCGQCDDNSNRNADQAVYCSCRCDVADGEEKDENFNFCECPTGFECKEIRKNVGLGDEQITGKYCIKQGTEFVSSQNKCGQVKGHFDFQQCEGLAASL